MKKEKLGFFKKLILVITDFRTYPFLVKHEKFYKSFLYLINLILILSLILSINSVANTNKILKTVINNYEETIPEFELSQGVLNVHDKHGQKINNETFLTIDTGYTYKEYKNTKEYSKLVIYDTVILVNSDRIMVEFNGEPLPYGIIFEKIDYEMDKDSLYEEIITRYESTDRASYVVTAYISIFVSYTIIILVKLLFLTCLISFICFFTGVRLNFKNYLKIAIYTYTLPLIIEVIATCLVGSGKDYTYYTSLFLTYVYVIYAIRAIRLDAFIMMFSRKDNLKHTSNEFESELKKYDELLNNNEEKESKDEDDKNK